MTTLRVFFKQSIDNDQCVFSNKKEAIEVAKKMTANVSSFDFNKSDDYMYMVFSEYVDVDVIENGEPLYSLISDVKPVMDGGVFCSVRRLK